MSHLRGAGLGRCQSNPARRKIGASPALVAVLAVVLVATASGAKAANFGSAGTAGTFGLTNGVWLQVNSTWTVAKVSLEAGTANAVDSVMSTQYGPTVLNVSVSTASCASYDTCVSDSWYGANGAAGWNQCAGTTAGSHPNQTCTQTFVKVNLSYAIDEDVVVCHELGHSVGLRHTSSTTSCMYTSATTVYVLEPHDIGHIDGHY